MLSSRRRPRRASRNFKSLPASADGFRELHDDIDADAAYDLAGRGLTSQPDPLVAAYYSRLRRCPHQRGSPRARLDYFQRSRTIYRRIGTIPHPASRR